MLFIEQQSTILCHSLSFNHDAGFLAVVEEADLCAAIGTKLYVGIPVKCPSIVFLPFFRRIEMIVRVVEIFLVSETG